MAVRRSLLPFGGDDDVGDLSTPAGTAGSRSFQTSERPVSTSGRETRAGASLKNQCEEEEV